MPYFEQNFLTFRNFLLDYKRYTKSHFKPDIMPFFKPDFKPDY